MRRHFSEARTEDIAVDLLNIQGWPIGRPPKGRTVRQNEYKSFPTLEMLFRAKSKTGSGDGYPDFLLVNDATLRPEMVIETKAELRNIGRAFDEACHYGDACRDAGFPVVVVGIAGQEKIGIDIRVATFYDGGWQTVVYDGIPISWIPTPDDVQRLIVAQDSIDLAPVVPRPEILGEKAELMNRILREADVKDEYRPAYIGAMMLALWQSKGSIDRGPSHILEDVNRFCTQAFSVGGKPELAKSLYVDRANVKLANSAWEIMLTLEKLNVIAGSVDHDYLGQLYEIFFRYTGGNTIGQYFTPRHITKFMADICETTRDDKIIDPACGTGGFLIACIQRAYENLGIKYEDAIKMIENNLTGYESEPVTAALCVANMILRGDGKTGIHKDDCFRATNFPSGTYQVALMNPPFPHKSTDVPPETFIERALQALENRGLLAVIIPSSFLVKKQEWRKQILKNNSLEAVCELPDELFQPFASATTSIIVLRKGIPHNIAKRTVFVKVKNDGLTLKKKIRVIRGDNKNDLPAASNAIINKVEIPGLSGVVGISGDDDWATGAYIQTSIPTDEELLVGIDELIRKFTAFYTRYAKEVAKQRQLILNGILVPSPYREMIGDRRIENAKNLTSDPGTIGEFFDIYYGQKELHSRDGIPQGNSLIISPTEEYNGCYGWLHFDKLITPSFVTVAQTGTIGEAFVQCEPCGVNDDCLLLLPKQDVELPIASLFIAATILRLEKWRFNYGRKLTPARISNFKMSRMPQIEKWVEQRLATQSKIIEIALGEYLK